VAPAAAPGPGLVLEPRAYSGTVTLAGNFSVGTLVVDCGAIKQADPVGLNPPVPYALNAGTLTVTSSLSWTGGTLNSNDVHGQIHLAPGASGIAEPSYTNPGINQTVGLGSTITLQGNPTTNPDEPDIAPGSTLDVLSGQYDISNNAGFVVGSQCSLRMMPDPQDAPRGGGGGGQPQYKASVDFLNGGTLNEAGSVTAKEGSTVTFEPKLRPADSTDLAVYDAPKGTLKNEGGKVVIANRVQAKFGGDTPTAFTTGNPNPVAVNASVYRTVGTSKPEKTILSLQAGSQLITSKGVAVVGGSIVSPALNPDGTQTQFQPDAYIKATTANSYALLLGSQASVDLPGNPYRTLRLHGSFLWRGTVTLAINPADETKHDSIEVDGYVRIDDTTPKLKLTWAETADGTMAGRTRGTQWSVVTSTKATDGITGDAKVNPPVLPTFTQVTMETQADPDKRELKVRKTSNPQ
jgi:hypothetical protein